MKNNNLKVDKSQVPGVVINHVPASTKKYIGSPAIAVLDKGQYVVSHDYFGPGSSYSNSVVYHSKDNGKSWDKISELENQFWSNLFKFQGKLYIFGTDGRYGKIVIRRSEDGGKTWTVPEGENSGLLTKQEGYHCAPMPVVSYKGRLWRAFEKREEEEFKAFIMSISQGDDLLQAENWKKTNYISHKKAGFIWREGNIIEDKTNQELLDIIRFEPPEGGKAAVIHIEDEYNLNFNPEQDIINFPGGSKKFVIRYDRQSDLYWTLSNPVLDKYKGHDPERTRNVLAAVTSSDLRNWEIKHIILENPDVKKHGFQYVDWEIEGDNLIAVSRTSFEDGLGGAHNCHDANFLTFHIIENFRKYK